MDEKNTCSFHSFYSSEVCSESESFCAVDSLPSTLSAIILTESGLFYGKQTNSFNICQNHIKSIREKNHQPRKIKCCGIPQFIASHTIKNLKRSGKQKSNRHLTIQQVEDVRGNYGIVLPIGTSICTSCRAKLFKHEDDHQDCIDEVQGDDQSSGRFFLRPRVEVHYNENENIASSEETQPSQESQASEASVSGVDRLSKLNEFLSICNASPVKKIREPFETSSERTKRRYAAKANECLALPLDEISGFSAAETLWKLCGNLRLL